MKKILLLCLLALSLMVVPSFAGTKLPSLYLGYVFTTHHTPLLVAAKKGDLLKESGAYLKPMVNKQKYTLMTEDGRALAVLNFIVSKSGSETATLFAMNRLDFGLASSTAFMSGIDKGMKAKVLCPLHVDGISMVFPAGSTINGYEDVAKAIKESQHAFRIGYHSPTSAPRVAFEGALNKAGFSITTNPNDLDADILMVDLKSTSNLIPALLSHQVDAWVGPAPHPVVAESKGVGHIGLNSRQLPPKGEWEDFPCCVLGASDQMITEQPEIVQALTNLLTGAAKYSNENKVETAAISAEWLGVPASAVEKSAIIYSTDPTPKWLAGEASFLSVLNSMNKFQGKMKDAKLADISPIFFDFSFVEKSLAHQ